MIIAVNTRLKKEEQPEGYSTFMFEILDGLTNKFPQHQFVYFFDGPYDEKLKFNKNVLPMVAGPKTNNSLGLRYWLNYKIPTLLRKHKADVFISMDGTCSLRTKIPQLLMVSDLRFIQQPELIKKSQVRFYKRFTPAFLVKAKNVVTVSEYSKLIIADHYKINAIDITVINPSINELFKPIEWEEKEYIKEKYAESKSYFLFSGDINQGSNIINLLKAFSFFKKRQKSNMMMLIAGKANESFKKELKNYTYKMEVKLLEDLSILNLAKITGAAYALVHPVLYSDFSISPLQAIQCGVPVIAADTGALPIILGEAALYTIPNDFKDIAENMMLIFKDEKKARKLVITGYAILNQYQKDKSAEFFMKSILKAFHN